MQDWQRIAGRLTLPHRAMCRRQHVSLLFVLMIASVQSFVCALPPAVAHAAPDAPPDPELAAVAALGIQSLSHDDYIKDFPNLSQRRNRIPGAVRNNKWHRGHAAS